MPFLKLTTNNTLNQEEAAQLTQAFSKLLAKETGKPERYVMVALDFDKTMLFAGSPDPLAFIECKSIGLTTTQAKALSSSLNKLIASSLQIAADRVYIEFSNSSADYWGWNGSTFG